MEPTTPFRTAFKYNNYMYVLAGVVAQKLAGGDTWEQLVTNNIFTPLGMNMSGFVDDDTEPEDFALAYTVVNKTLVKVDPRVAQ